MGLCWPGRVWPQSLAMQHEAALLTTVEACNRTNWRHKPDHFYILLQTGFLIELHSHQIISGIFPSWLPGPLDQLPTSPSPVTALSGSNLRPKQILLELKQGLKELCWNLGPWSPATEQLTGVYSRSQWSCTSSSFRPNCTHFRSYFGSGI